MIVVFRDKKLQRLYEEGSFRLPNVPPEVVKAYRRKMQVIVSASSELDLRTMQSLRFEKLRGNRAGQHSIRLNDQWRLIFTLESNDQGKTVVIIEIVDYH